MRLPKIFWKNQKCWPILGGLVAGVAEYGRLVSPQPPEHLHTLELEEEQQQLHQRRERELARQQREANVRKWIEELNWVNGQSEEQTQIQKDPAGTAERSSVQAGFRWKELAPGSVWVPATSKLMNNNFVACSRKAGQPVRWGTATTQGSGRLDFIHSRQLTPATTSPGQFSSHREERSVFYCRCCQNQGLR